ncbi:hypothetical protein ACFPL7_05460 [Dongia soli]|uniref:Uncharacterized protein n=1 Tax=Dongia soli TaxID=600628 RepID=A0ABU5EF90_9PROT|nr:hypothetical protein [Dongia soli]MDY0884847.1 hypothetical protein [Dongia soli]
MQRDTPTTITNHCRTSATNQLVTLGLDPDPPERLMKDIPLASVHHPYLAPWPASTVDPRIKSGGDKLVRCERRAKKSARGVRWLETSRSIVILGLDPRIHRGDSTGICQPESWTI